MTNQAISIKNYSFAAGENLLLDANIWLYLFPAPSGSTSPSAKIYTEAFKSIISTKASIFLSSTILSEYLNRYCRIEWAALHKLEFPEFKNFRKSAKFQSVGETAAEYARNIVKQSTKIDDLFSGVDVPEILGGFAAGSADFNDALIVNSCIKNSLKLVTNDADFTEGGIEILTNNHRLLSACQVAKVA